MPRAGRWRSSEHLHYYICIIIIQYISYNDIMWTGRATQQFWKSTTQKSALAKGTVATLPPRKIFLCFFSWSVYLSFPLSTFQQWSAGAPSLWLPSCPPWLLATCYTRPSSPVQWRAVQPQSGGRRQNPANTQKLSPEKPLWPPDKSVRSQILPSNEKIWGCSQALWRSCLLSRTVINPKPGFL